MNDSRVVAGIDGSAEAEAAIRWAAAEAAARGAELHLVHAFVWPLFPVPVGPSSVAPGLRAMADKIVADSQDLARKLEPGVRITAELVEGFPSPVLLEQSRTAGLVVIGSRGLRGALRLLVGSTGLDLAANAHCPVVVVRPDQPGDSGSRVVIGYDGSPASEAAVDFGLAYAERRGIDVRVASVQSPDADRHRLTHHDLAAAVQRRDGGAVAELVHVTGHPAEQLIQWSADARLVVIGSRGRGGFTALLLGSISQAILQHADCPVAVIPSAALEAGSH